MAAFLGRRRRWVVGGWLLVVALALPLARQQTNHLTGGGFDVPGSQTAAVQDASAAHFPRQTRGILVVLRASATSTAGQRLAALARLRQAVGAVGHLQLGAGAVRRGQKQLEHRGLALVPLTSDEGQDRIIDVAKDLRNRVDPGVTQQGVTPYLVGEPALFAAYQEQSRKDLAEAEALGVPIVALILLAVFGSLAAAALPLALALVSVTITGAVIYFVSLEMTTSLFVTNLASLVGIGVAVDYSLFVLARYREEVRAGSSPDQARATALMTSGVAVAFSGLAVVISLASLWMVDNQTLRSMALGAMVVVAVSVLAATTLLPALIAVFGQRVTRKGFPARATAALRGFFTRPRGEPSAKAAFWDRWTERVMARPWSAIVLVLVVVALLATPVLSIRLGNTAISQFPPGHDVRVGTDLAAKATGGGVDPLEILVQFPRRGMSDPSNRQTVTKLTRALERDPEIGRVATPVPAPHSVLIDATTRDSSESRSVIALVDRLRKATAPGGKIARSATISIGGTAAGIKDFRAQIGGSMARIILFILSFSFLMMLLMLRSILLPLKAILMNLLTVGAAYGVLVVVYQWGWLDGFLGFHSLGAIDTLNPPLILAVIFGLSMDYEVFLLSRIRERYLLHGDNRRAVAEGLATSAGTISSAALIMTAVFAVFVLTGVPQIRQIGLGLAVAVALDATLVRLILVPAAMQLMGRWNWWLPGWLDRLVPELNTEIDRAAVASIEPQADSAA